MTDRTQELELVASICTLLEGKDAEDVMNALICVLGGMLAYVSDDKEKLATHCHQASEDVLDMAMQHWEMTKGSESNANPSS